MSKVLKHTNNKKGVDLFMSNNYDYDMFYGYDCHCDGCSSLGCQFADIKVPIEIEPDVTVGEIETECCDKTCVKCKDCGCGVSEIVLTQKVKIKIPVKFCVKADVKDISISCDDCRC